MIKVQRRGADQEETMNIRLQAAGAAGQALKSFEEMALRV